MADEIILVAGVDYPKFKRDGRDLGPRTRWNLESVLGPGEWRTLSLRYAEKVLKTRKEVIVTLFDVLKGTQETLSLGKNGKVQTTGTPVEWGALKPENYRRVSSDNTSLFPVPVKKDPRNPEIVTDASARVAYFGKISDAGLGSGPILTSAYLRFHGLHTSAPESPPDNGISIKSIYQYILSTPNKVIELHMFSHGWAGGPILVNSNDLFPRLEKRDPFDHDGRARKDFLDVNLRNDRDFHIADFRSKFADGATSVIWGCNAFDFWRLAIRQAITKSAGTSRPSFRIEFSPDMHLQRGLDDFHDFLGGSGNVSDRFTMDMFVFRVRSQGIEFTYMKKLAQASGKLVIGALPGTSGNYDEKPPKGSTLKSVQLMHIPQRRREDEGSSLTDIMRFYKDKLSVRFELSEKLKLSDDPGDFDPNFGRGYASFDP